MAKQDNKKHPDGCFLFVGAVMVLKPQKNAP